MLALLGAMQTAPATAQTTTACTGNTPGGELVAQRVYSATRPDDGLFEGPVWLNGSLYFSDFLFSPGNPSRVNRLNPDGSVTLDVIPNSGSNGLALDNNRNLVSANHRFSGLVRFDPYTNAPTTIVNQFNGSTFNSPNDLTFAADGTIYFTDPDYQRAATNPGQPRTRVYRRAPNGTVTVVDETLLQPNGVVLSPDGKTLYVSSGDNNVYKYTIVNGVPGNRTVFFSGLRGPDGMGIDCFGALYVAEYNAGSVRVIGANGAQKAEIRMDPNANATNVAFGGADGRTLYVTGMKSIWKIQLSAPGKAY